MKVSAHSQLEGRGRGWGYLKDAFGKTDRVFLQDCGFIGRLFEFGWQVIDVFDADHDRRASLIQGIGCPQLEYVLTETIHSCQRNSSKRKRETGKECKKEEENAKKYEWHRQMLKQ
jgi:hypothetical protein